MVIGVESVDVHWYTYVMLLNERKKRFEEKEERGVRMSNEKEEGEREEFTRRISMEGC